MHLLIGTGNKGKLIEISQALADLDVSPFSPADLGIAGDPEETGETYGENALIKARFFRAHSGLPVLADDSGIQVEALKSELGIHTRRWGAGKSATDEEWIAFFLDRMHKEENKRASFVCVIAYIDQAGNEHLFEGRCDGAITESLEAEYLPGLPISACFKPDGYDNVFSALNIDEKNAVSHRGRALQLLREHLADQLKKPDHTLSM